MSESPSTSPTNKLQEFYLRPARITDLASVAKVWTAAFFDDEVIGNLMHPNRKEYPDDVYWFLLRGIREHFWHWRHHLIVVATKGPDQEGQEVIAGAADWRRLGDEAAARDLVWFDPRNLIKPILSRYHKASLALFPNRAADPTQSSWLDNAVAASEKYWTGERSECWDLHICGVHPDLQGKGAGKLLAQWGVCEAEKEGKHVVASVLCGEKNRGFYNKAGFQVQVGGGSNGIALFTK